MSVTVAQALKFGGLAHGRLLAGESCIDHVIDRVSILEIPCDPEWDYHNCLFITTFYALKDNPDSQVRTIEMLAGRGCSALVFQLGVLNRLPDEVIGRAEALGLPVIEIPEAVTYPEVITPLVGAILEEKAYLLQRSEEIHRRLTDLCLSGGGLPVIAASLSELVNQPVAIADAWGSLITSANFSRPEQRILDWLKTAVRNQALSALQPVYDAEARVWLMQLFTGGQRRSDGYILVEDPASELDPVDLLAIEQASIIAALEVVKQRAILETERRLQRDFLENLLSEGSASEEDLSSRAHSLGWELSDKRVVVLVDLSHLKRHLTVARGPLPLDHKSHFLEAFTALLNERDPQAIIVDQGDYLVLLPGCESSQIDAAARRPLQAMLESMLSQAKTRGGDFPIVFSIGAFHAKVQELRQSYDEARLALRVGKRLSLPQPIIWYDEVALYVLLERIADQPETAGWYERTLGRLVNYDRANNTDLVRTLEAYFDSNQSLQQAAFTLFVHPKTLKYRLHRIQEILGIDPFSKDQQLTYYLATKLARLFDFSPRG